MDAQSECLEGGVGGRWGPDEMRKGEEEGEEGEKEEEKLGFVGSM